MKEPGGGVPVTTQTRHHTQQNANKCSIREKLPLKFGPTTLIPIISLAHFKDFTGKNFLHQNTMMHLIIPPSTNVECKFYHVICLYNTQNKNHSSHCLWEVRTRQTRHAHGLLGRQVRREGRQEGRREGRGDGKLSVLLGWSRQALTDWTCLLT